MNEDIVIPRKYQGRPLVTTREMCDVLKVSRKAIASMVKQGMPCLGRGPRVTKRYPLVACLAWIQRTAREVDE